MPQERAWPRRAAGRRYVPQIPDPFCREMAGTILKLGLVGPGRRPALHPQRWPSAHPPAGTQARLGAGGAVGAVRLAVGLRRGPRAFMEVGREVTGGRKTHA